MGSLRARAAGVLAAPGAWPASLAAAPAAVAGAAIGGGASGAIGAAAGLATGALIGAGLAFLVRWRRPWYLRLGVGVGFTIGAAAVLTLYLVGVIAGGGGTRPIPKQSTPDRATRLVLERRFAPVLRLNRRPAELFVPISRPTYVAIAQLKKRLGNVESIVQESPTIRSLPRQPCAAPPGCVYFLDVLGAEPDPPNASAPAYDALEEQALAHHRARRVVYAHVTRYSDSGDYAVQYWFLYFFNYRLNEHESDWEEITIHLDPEQRPVNAFYSAHVCGHERKWQKIEQLDGHPVDYVALGSHANYFAHGHPSVALKRIAISKRKTVCVIERGSRDLADGRGRVLRLDRGYELRELTGPVFAGSYGSGNYVLGKKKPDPLSDPRTRTSWRDPLAELG